MDKELLSKQKEIDNLINKRSNLTTIVLVIAGGALSLFISLDNIIKVFLFIMGMLFFVFFLKGLLNIEERIYKLIKELKL
jgi:hypothetical protein